MKCSSSFCLAFILAFQLCATGCGSASQVDDLLLNSHRIVGYTETARQIVSDLRDDNQITDQQALSVVRPLQRLHSTHAQLYEILKASINPATGELALTPEAVAKMGALAMGLRANVPQQQAITMPSGNRIQPLLTSLTAAVESFAGRILKAKPASKNSGSVWKLLRAQVAQFERQYTDVKELEACLTYQP